MIRILTLAAAAAPVLGHINASPHDWIAPGPGDVRSPCPGLNVLANHGFLPHSGQNITGPMFKSAIMKVYNFDDQLASFFADGGLSVDGPKKPSINLDMLDKHDAIEHDASLSRDDWIQGNNYAVQPELVAKLIADAAPDQVLSVASLAKSRNRRDAESLAVGGKPLPLKLRTFAYGESALILQVLGELSNDPSGELLPPVSAIQQWIGEEKLPTGWHRPESQVTLFRTTSLSGKVATAANLPFTGDLLSATTGVLRRKMSRRAMWPVHGGLTLEE